MYYIPLILTAGILIVFLFGTVLIGLTAVKIKSFGSSKNIKALSKEYRNEFIRAYNKAFAAMNLKAMTNMLTDYMYYTTECTLKVLNKLNLRKEVEFTPDPEFEKIADRNQFNIVQSDGKNDFTLSNMKGEYKETYYDLNTNKKIFSRKKKTSYNIHFAKCNENLNDKPCLCMNCGGELVHNGNMLDCPYCDSHYHAENYDWNISDIQVSGDDANPWVTPILIISFIAIIIAALEGLFLHNIPLFIAFIVIDAIAALFTFKYIGYVYTGVQTLKEIEKHDPKSSRTILFKRINYLIRALEQAKDYDINNIKAFMPEELFNALRKVNKYDDYYLVDFEIVKMYPHNYRIENDYQFVDLDLTMNRLMMNPNHKIKEKKIKSKYTVYKNIKAMTVTNSSAQSISCPNCGASINLTRDNICVYCEAGIDISMYDWIFANVPLELTK